MSTVRFLHVSDLHVGSLDSDGLPYAPAFYRRFVNGWLGHDPLALRASARLARRLRRDGVPLHVVMTGDLTARGDPDQFRTATEFLQATTDDGPYPVGLRDAGAHDRTIPGNHDRWKGDYGFGTVWAFPHMVLPPTQAFHALFDHLPATGDPVLSVLGLPPVRFVRIDTDADVTTVRDRMLARGRFRSHLAWLDQRLPPKQGGEVRVVLAHHCREVRGALEIDEDTRRDFDDFLVRHGADALLSGHKHDALLAQRTIEGDGTTRDVLYARCGTTAQLSPRDLRPKRLAGLDGTREAFAGYPKSVERSLFLHELTRGESEVTWTTTGYVLDRQNQFRPRTALSGAWTLPT